MSPDIPSDKRIYDAYIASRQSAALAAGLRAGLFELLAERPMDLAEIARRLDLSPRPVRLLTRVLVTMGLLVRQGETLRLADDSAIYLVRGQPGYLGALIDLEVENYLSPAMLLDALKHDAPSVYGAADPWARHADDPQRAAAFTAAMHGISSGPARALAELLDLSSARRLLDLGGGSGAVSLALARKNPGLRCVILELASVCALAQPFIDLAGLADRVTTQVGDIFAELPRGFDVILLSQILHDWSPGTGLELLRHSYHALPRGGRVVIHEKLVSEAGSGPLANSLVDLDMLVWTEGEQQSESGLWQQLARAGFVEIRCRPTTGYWSVVDASRP